MQAHSLNDPTVVRPSIQPVVAPFSGCTLHQLWLKMHSTATLQRRGSELEPVFCCQRLFFFCGEKAGRQIGSSAATQMQTQEDKNQGKRLQRVASIKVNLDERGLAVHQHDEV